MAAKAGAGVFIVAAKRTPFGSMGGKLSKLSPTDLCTASTMAALKQINLDPKLVDNIFVGNVSGTAPDSPYISRHVGLRCGIPIETPAVTVNRLCGSGFESIVQASKAILTGESQISLAGGGENMSMAPYILRDVRQGTKFPNDLKLEDSLWSALTDFHIKMPMAMTAEKLGAQYGVTREECDKYAMRSQLGWQAAKDQGFFDQEIVPIEVKGKKGSDVVSVDEYPRGKATSLEQLAKLPSLFKQEGLVTAGNASGINDGAGSLILASEEAVKQHKLTPLARVVSWCSVGVEPSLMGYGPVPSIRAALKAAGLRVEDMDRVEINEAFAAQYLACEKELGLDREKTNINGGAIAMGHPTGASGSRIMSHLTYELRRTGKRYAVGSACCGGGQGISIIIERC